MSGASLGKHQHEARRAEDALAAERAREPVTVYVVNGVSTSAGLGARREAAAIGRGRSAGQ
jgi:hypothetical protein